VEPNSISTFDNKTFEYSVNDCYHLLFKDCSGKIPVAVLAKTELGPKYFKTIEILSGRSKLILKPKSKSENKGLTIEYNVKKMSMKSIEFTNGSSVHYEFCPDSKDVLFEIRSYADNVYNVRFHNEKLEVKTFNLKF